VAKVTGATVKLARRVRLGDLRVTACAMKELLHPDSGRVGLDRVVELANRHLGLDVVYIAELTDARQVYRAVAGDGASFKIATGECAGARAGLVGRLVAGEIANVIRDAGADERVADLPMTREARIGSFIGVPLRLSDGTMYGALCALSHAPDPTLDERDVRFMSMLGDLIVDDLDEQRRQERLRSAILELIETENLDVAYQPIIDLRRDRCIGIEALARFAEPFERPDATLAAAHKLGLSLELERLVVRHAWKMLARLGPGQFLSLNLSPDALVELARRANLRENLRVDQIVVEITEHTVVDSYVALHRELGPLRQRGLRIAVDDAGAGYASLRHVLELRPDFIKVDRSLIHGIASDHARRVAVSAFLSLALDLGSRVVAEGVERPDDLATVRDLGLHAVQGYLLGRPTTSRDALAEWIGPEPQLNRVDPAPISCRGGTAKPSRHGWQRRSRERTRRADLHAARHRRRGPISGGRRPPSVERSCQPAARLARELLVGSKRVERADDHLPEVLAIAVGALECAEQLIERRPEVALIERRERVCELTVAFEPQAGREAIGLEAPVDGLQELASLVSLAA
jgi:EAL domain-containing protein (putative c-di-GMP-specific phosphodiesterase class I)